MSKIKKIGIIVEDESDFESFRNLIRRITNKDRLSFAKHIGNGCGKIRRKAQDYCRNLENRGCDLLLLVHDLDKNNLVELEQDLSKKFKSSKPHFICIPTEELEAWFLSDPEGIKEALNLKRKPNVKGQPETISSPKEYLGHQIKSCSDNEKIYLNTKHNALLSSKVSIALIKQKCVSFDKFHTFILDKKY